MIKHLYFTREKNIKQLVRYDRKNEILRVLDHYFYIPERLYNLIKHKNICMKNKKCYVDNKELFTFIFSLTNREEKTLIFFKNNFHKNYRRSQKLAINTNRNCKTN